METNPYIFCDWTLLDLIGRFIMFCVWGYLMGKSVTHSPNTTWALTFTGVLSCAFIHTWMHFNNLPQYDIYASGLYNESIESAREDLITYGIKVFLFYLTASVIGYRAGRQKAKEKIVELDMVLAALKRWEAQGLIDEFEPDNHRQGMSAILNKLFNRLRNHHLIRKLIHYLTRKP